MLRAEVQSWIDKKKITKKELSETGEITRQAVNSYLRGSDVRISVVEKWAKKWPDMIIKGLNYKRMPIQHPENAFEMMEEIERIYELELIKRKIKPNGSTSEVIKTIMYRAIVDCRIDAGLISILLSSIEREIINHEKLIRKEIKN